MAGDFFFARKLLKGSAHTGAACRHDLAGISAPRAAEVGELRAVLQRAKVRSSDGPQERGCHTPLALASLDQRPQVCGETFGFFS